MTATAVCPRCSRASYLDDRFCGGCGAARGPVAPLTAAVDGAFADSAVTEAFTVPLQRMASTAGAGPRHAAPEPSDQPGPVGVGSAVQLGVPPWVAPALLGAAGLAQLVDVLVDFPTESVNGADWSTLAVLTLPGFGIVGAAVGVAVAAWQRAASARVYAVVLALVVATAGLFSGVESAPGPLACMLAVAAALLLVLPTEAAAASSGAPDVALAGWVSGACVAAALYAFVISHEVDGGTSGQVVAGVLFLVTGVAVVGCGSQLTGRAEVRWALAGLWVLTAVAVASSDLGDHLLWPLLTLHASLAVVVLWPVVPDPVRARLRREVSSRLVSVPRVWLLGAGGAVVLLVGLAVGFGGVSSTSGSSGTGSLVAVVGVAILSCAAACTPTMTPPWRGGLVAGAVLAVALAWDGARALTDGESTLVWTVLIPAALVGCSAWGWWTNRRTGATASQAGWVGPGSLPPMVPVPFVAPPTAGARSRVCLEVSCAVAPEMVLEAVRRATAVRGNWFRTYGDAVAVVGSAPGVVGLKIGGTCTFRAVVTDEEGRTALRVGGMDRWTKSRWYFDFIIPISPAKVEGFRMYKLYLATVASEIIRLDPSARVRIGQPGA